MKLNYDFFHRDCLEVAPDLVGKLLCRKTQDGIRTLRISQTEAYRGESDSACHAHHGRTPRTEALYAKAGTIYIYLCYGIHWLLNAVTGDEGEPQAVLIRACIDAEGPAKLTKALAIDKTLHSQSFVKNDFLWIEDDGFHPKLKTATRVGINYAAPEDREKPWRFILL